MTRRTRRDDLSRRLGVGIACSIVGFLLGVLGTLYFVNQADFRVGFYVIVGFLIVLVSMMMGVFLGFKFLRAGAEISLTAMAENDTWDARKMKALAELVGAVQKGTPVNLPLGYSGDVLTSVAGPMGTPHLPPVEVFEPENPGRGFRS